MNCYLCAMPQLFSILLRFQADGDESPQRHPITYEGQASEGTYKSSAFLKMDKSLNFVSGEKYQNDLSEL